MDKQMARSILCIVSAGVLFGAAMSACKRNEESPSKTTAAQPNIIFLTVDTLRTEHLEFYGYSRETMPAVAAFAKSAKVFDNAVVPRGSTRESYASMLTGMYPFHHGVRSLVRVLHDDLVTLPEILRSNGYHTAGFVSNFVLIGEQSGFDQGFDVYDDRLEEAEPNRPNYERTAGRTLKAILEWLASDPPQPFFLFTNVIDPHGPYRPPERFRKLYKSEVHRDLPLAAIPSYQRIEGITDYYDYVDRYDAEIRYVDETLGILIEELKRRGLWDQSLVVFTADHGEALGEHGQLFEHQYNVFEETMRVPLAIRLPVTAGGQPNPVPGRVESLCSPMDLPQTVLDYLGLPQNGRFDGKSILPLIGGADDPDRFLFLEFPDVSTLTRSTPDVYGVRTATHKMIRTLEVRTGKVLRQTVYNLAADPLEQQGMLYDEESEVHRALGEQLDAMIALVHDYKLPFVLTEYAMPLEHRTEFINQRQRTQEKISKPLTQDAIDRLRSLGYVE